MSGYEFSSPEDFLENDRFRGWVMGLHPEDKALWETFLAQHPDKRAMYEKAVATLLVINAVEPASSAEADKAAALRELIGGQSGQDNEFPLWRWMRWAVAAMLVISAGFWWVNSQKTITKAGHVAGQAAGTEWEVRENQSQELLLVNLPDGSSVLLSKESSIRFMADMTGPERKVYLDGEGFFEVVKNPGKPFFVTTDKLTTRVLGTSFRVRSYPGAEEALVAVKTGKVSVTTDGHREGDVSSLTLYPNQQVNLIRKKDKIMRAVTAAVQVNQATPIEKEPFNFEFTPVSEAFKTLETQYAVKIHYDLEKMSRCTITASLKDEPFLEKLRLICLATESSFAVNGDEIMISGLGCP
nr:FecR family protein [uncultured Dyadobacter sp.]